MMAVGSAKLPTWDNERNGVETSVNLDESSVAANAGLIKLGECPLSIIYLYVLL